MTTSRTDRTQRGPIVVVGAGPAGLTTAFELSNHAVPSLVLEQDGTVGGIARTVEHQGFRFDLGGHRFFSKVALVNAIWEELLGDELLERPRMSRIHYRGRWFRYPLRPFDALAGLGAVDAVRVVTSYLWAQVRPHPVEENFEQWVSNRFGRRLFETFFKSYTEKVWGISTSELSADWAAQRIQNLSLGRAIRHSLVGGNGDITKTLIDAFRYPRLGPGQLWEKCRDVVRERGSVVEHHVSMRKAIREGSRVVALRVDRGGMTDELDVGELVSSMPLGELVAAFEPGPPPAVLAAARRLKHRGMVVVSLMVDAQSLFPDNWIYVHTPGVKVGRVQNFKNWSPSMVPDPSKSSLGMEYFLWPSDALWSQPDAQWIELAAREATQLGLVNGHRIEGGHVARVPQAYPVYGTGYREDVACVRAWLDELENVQTIGRNGLHRYNNQDHSMMTGVYAARNVLGEKFDVWSVNVEAEYLEETSIPRPHTTSVPSEIRPVPAGPAVAA